MYETHDKKALLLPNVTSADAGKVLAVDENGKLSLEEIASELPTLTGNAGKVLTVASGASGVEWKDVPSELPSLTGNAGKFLKVDSDAEGVEWSEAGGGGGGLTLYGPYFAKNNSQASVGTSGELIQLDKIFDMDDNEFRPNNDAVYLLQSFGGSTGINIQNASVYSIFATSLTGSTVTVGQFDCVVGFYSTIELQPVG